MTSSRAPVLSMRSRSPARGPWETASSPAPTCTWSELEKKMRALARWGRLTSMKLPRRLWRLNAVSSLMRYRRSLTFQVHHLHKSQGVSLKKCAWWTDIPKKFAAAGPWSRRSPAASSTCWIASWPWMSITQLIHPLEQGDLLSVAFFPGSWTSSAKSPGTNIRCSASSLPRASCSR